MAYNVDAAKAGFHRDHAENALAIGVGGRMVKNFSGNADTGILTFPPYKGGQTGWDNQAIPNVHLCDQTQQYPTGTIYRYGYQTFVYTYLQSATSGRNISDAQGSGVLSENPPQDGTVVTATTDTTSLVAAATATANQYAGGFVGLYESGVTHNSGFYRIVSNTATVSSNVTFTLDRYLVTTYSASATCRLHPDPYDNVRFPLSSRTSSANFEMLAGIWIAAEDEDGTAAAEGDYAWIQTGGPCYTWAAVTYEGGTAHERMAYHQGGGDIQICTATDAHPGAQIVGYLIPATSSDPGVSTSGTDVDMLEHLIWLQIMP